MIRCLPNYFYSNFFSNAFLDNFLYTEKTETIINKDGIQDACAVDVKCRKCLNTTLIIDSDDKLPIPQILYSNQKETSVLLPHGCGYLTTFWCQLNEFTFKGVHNCGKKSEVFRMGGSLQGWMDRHRPKN